MLLHAVLLASAVRLFPERLEVPGASLQAVLSDRRAALPAPSASPARPASAAAKPSVPRLVATPAEAPAAVLSSVAAHENSRSASLDAAGHAAVSPASGAAASPNSASNASSGTAPATGRPGVSGDDLRQYRLSLASAARRFKQYPAQARQRGWEGTVEVALSVGALAPVPEVVLVRSSGRAVLDEQALDMLTQAARVTALPEGLRARDFRLVLPVQFSLENDQ